MTRITTPTAEQAAQLRQAFPVRHLPPGFYSSFARLDPDEQRGLVDASLIATAKHLDRICSDPSLDDEQAIEAMTDHVIGFLRLVALGNIALDKDLAGRVYRTDPPGPSPEETKSIEDCLHNLRPVVLEALKQHAWPE
ncbi:MAG TPA: hypothetical protein PLS53_15380 [Thermoanaerobaculaceae bacterium]|nr:hypothetical protein [Thermoanaerobaculaceae bacterium]HPS79541.1 hypothetical protein [Thermoanaerobaculaceae bacterium]